MPSRAIGETLDVTDAAAWRAWLQEHHASKDEVWLVFHSKASGRPSISYNDAVEEALCFGWIDSVNKKLDADRRVQRFTPRRPGSPVSEMNKVRAHRLIEAGRMTTAGLSKIQAYLDEPLVLAEDILEALRADPVAWRNFQDFPESYKRIRTGWIEAARPRPQTFRQRLDYFVRMTAKGKRFGMVQ